MVLALSEEEKLDRLSRMDQLVAAARVFDREEDNYSFGDRAGTGLVDGGGLGTGLGSGDGGLERLRRYLDSMQLAAEEEVG